MKSYIYALLAGALLLPACQSSDSEPSETGPQARTVAMSSSPGLSDYWYQGKAELNRYTLQQNRYADVHPGEAILVFVTEDFLTDKQVKNDHYTNPNSTPILKTNLIKEFPTGLYKYSIMTSVFTPVKTNEFPLSLKVTNSSQEWCGQTYMQVNYNQEEKAYDYHLHSYFEKEADKMGQVEAVMFEEELFNRIRINPAALPIGDMQILPATEFSRLTHREYTPTQAKAQMNDYAGEEFTGDALKAYKLEFPELNRTLEIVFEAASPYRIAGWKDTYPSMFDGKMRSTVAVRTHTILDAYWSHNALSDMPKRAELGLD